MSRVALHFPRRARILLYGNVLLSFASGTLWFSLHRWGQSEGEFGPEPTSLEPWLIKIHGASAFLALIGLGYLLATHVHVAWRTRLNRFFGLTLLIVIIALGLSGYVLYYGQGEALHEITRWVHLMLGLLLPLTLALHVWRGHRDRTRRASSRQRGKT